MTGSPVAVGLLDRGVTPDLIGHVQASRRFFRNDGGRPGTGTAEPDRLCHGSVLARVIFDKAPGTRLLNAQVYATSFATSPSVVAAGIDWLVRCDARVINMSFGLRADRQLLRAACDRALAAGTVLLAATPARGPMVYPAAYGGVISVSSDARCGSGELSTLAPRTDIGACPRPLDAGPDDPLPFGGASFAVAHVCGLVAAYLADHPATGRAQVLTYLRSKARYDGPERRTSGAAG